MDSLVEWHFEGEDQASQIPVKDGHTIFWHSVIDKQVNSTEQAQALHKIRQDEQISTGPRYSIVIA